MLRCCPVKSSAKIYYAPRTNGGYQKCAACAGVGSKSLVVEGHDLIWGDLQDNGRGCDFCGAERSEIEIEGEALIEFPRCKIF